MRNYIDWAKTAQNLKLLRNDNLNLRKFCCQALYYNKANCAGDCAACKFDMDASIGLVSQNELADVFGVSPGVVANWETGRTTPDIEDLIFYSKICDLGLSDVIVFKEEIKF